MRVFGILPVNEAHNEFGRVSSLKTDAVGQPGSRRFRLLLESRNGGWATLWLEKEQLFNLGVALKRIIATVEEESKEGEIESTLADEWDEPLAPSGQAVEFQVARLAVGYDERSALYIIAAYAAEDPEDATAVLNFMAAQHEMDALANEAFTVCAAGRPQCPLCGAPMGPEGHVCPRHNGHGTLVEA